MSELVGLSEVRSVTVQIVNELSDDIMAHVLDYLYPADIICLACTSKSISKSITNVWMCKMSCFRIRTEGLSDHYRQTINLARTDDQYEQDLFVLRFPFNQVDYSVKYGSCPWRYLRFYQQYIKHMKEDLRFDQVVGSMVHHDGRRNSIVPKERSEFAKGFGISNRIMRTGVFRVTFFVQDILCHGKLFGITRPSQYNSFRRYLLEPDPRCVRHARSYPEIYQRRTSINAAMISDFQVNGIHACTFNGNPQINEHRIRGSRQFPLGSRKNGSILSLELRMNSNGTDGSLLLIYPDHAPLVVATKLSGEYVWFAQSENWDAPHDVNVHHCEISILEYGA